MDIEIDERNNDNMIIEINELEIEIPEELVKERMIFLNIDNESEIRADLERKCAIYYKNYTNNNKPTENFNDCFIKYLNSELDIFRF